VERYRPEDHRWNEIIDAEDFKQETQSTKLWWKPEAI